MFAPRHSVPSLCGENRSSMRCSAVQLLVILAVQFSVPINAIPAFDINLDLPPQERWVNVAGYYAAELNDMLDKLIPLVGKKYPDKQDSWINDVRFDAEYEAELQGMVTAVDDPTVTVERLKWLNMLYEMDSPYTMLGCTGVLWAMPNGTVVQGRNMDDFSDDNRIIDWPGLTFEARLHKGGQMLMKFTQWPGSVGVHTGMRINGANQGWGVQQNTRRPNLWQENLAAAAQGGQVFGLALRRVMERAPDYQTAVNMIYNTKFMAPQYFILSGSGPFEGAVITIDRMAQHAAGTPPIQYLGNSTSDWHLVQTNDDITGYPADGRRPLANYLLQSTSRGITNNDMSMLEFMHTTQVFNSGTVFTTVMVPASSLYETILPDEPPEVMDGDAASQSIMGATPGMWPGIALTQRGADSVNFGRHKAPAAPRKRAFLAPQRQGDSDAAQLPADGLSLLQLPGRLEN